MVAIPKTLPNRTRPQSAQDIAEVLPGRRLRLNLHTGQIKAWDCMARFVLVLAGTQGAMEQTWGSTAHGAGRVLSRKAAIRKQHSNEVRAKLKQQGILVRSVGKKTLAEEAPEAYKDVDEVVAVCDGAGISRRVARLRPLAVVKG